MNKENLNNALLKFKSECKKELILLLTSKGHVESGKLNRSIEVDIKKNNEEYIIEINALQYLVYLEEGKLLKDFIKKQTEKLEKEVAKAYAKDIMKEIITK